MTILRLLQKANIINMLVAYEKLFPYEEYDLKNSRNINNVFKMNEYLLKVLKKITKSYTIENYKDDDKKIVYIIELENDDIENKKTTFLTFAINPKDIRFDLINPYEIYNYSSTYGFTTNKEKNNIIMNYDVCEKSIEEYGIDVCAAIILRNLIEWGFDEESVEINISNISKKLEEAEKDIEEGNLYSCEDIEEMFAKMRDEILEECDEYDKALILANEAKSEMLEPLKNKYREEKDEENTKTINDFIKKSLEKTSNIDEIMETLANRLNNREYRKETTKDDILFAKENKLIICYGASDDLLELEGIIDDEFGVFDGGTVYIDTNTLETSMENKYPYYINALWCEGEASWTYKTNLKHKTFEILEDDELYCIGMVIYIGE